MKAKFKVGDYIYYFKGKDSFPGRILKLNPGMVKIAYNGLDSDLKRWVSIHNIGLQDPCPVCGKR